MNYYETLPHFLLYFASALVLYSAFIATYIRVTPHKEFQLIKEGNAAVAVQLVGTTLGFALPLAAVIGHSVNLLDVFLWGFVAFVTQIVTFFIISSIFKDIELRLKDNCISSGILVGGVSLGVGILQAACQIPG